MAPARRWRRCAICSAHVQSDPEVTRWLRRGRSRRPLVDGLQAAGTGVLRGMGKPKVTAAYNAVGYFAIGIPLAWYLGLHTSLGLRGIWLGYAAGLLFVAAALVTTVLVRGPRTAVALVALAGPAAPSPLQASRDSGG